MVDTKSALGGKRMPEQGVAPASDDPNNPGVPVDTRDRIQGKPAPGEGKDGMVRKSNMDRKPK